MARLDDLEQIVRQHAKKLIEVEGQLTVNIRRRAPSLASASEFKHVVVTNQATSGRKKYTGFVRTYAVNLNGELVPASLGEEIEFWNKVEAVGGSPFLVVGDEVTVFKSGSIWVSESIPRGF